MEHHQQHYMGNYHLQDISHHFALHQRNEEPEKKFKCDLCHCSYTKNFTLSQHIRRCHKKETPYQCTYCPFAGVIKSELTAHLRKHGVYDKAYPCRHCSEVFNTPGKRRTHEMCHNGMMYTCKMCNYTTYSLSYYNKHTSKHTNNVQCRYCERTYTSNEKLNAHELTHSKINTGDVSDPNAESITYSKELNTTRTCSICNFEGTSLKALKLHVIKFHSDRLGTNNFNNRHFPKWNEAGECPLCGRVIPTPTERFTHLLSHIGISPFKCHLCDYKTGWIRNLKRHFNNHSNPTIWNCLECALTYDKKRDYILHNRKEHKVLNFLCDVCGKNFSNKSYFKKHLMKPHPVKDLSKDKHSNEKKEKPEGSKEQSKAKKRKKTVGQKAEKNVSSIKRDLNTQDDEIDDVVENRPKILKKRVSFIKRDLNKQDDEIDVVVGNRPKFLRKRVYSIKKDFNKQDDEIDDVVENRPKILRKRVCSIKKGLNTQDDEIDVVVGNRPKILKKRVSSIKKDLNTQDDEIDVVYENKPRILKKKKLQGFKEQRNVETTKKTDGQKTEKDIQKQLKNPRVKIILVSKENLKNLKIIKVQRSKGQTIVKETMKVVRQQTKKNQIPVINKAVINKANVDEDPPSFSDASKTITPEDVRKKYMRMSKMNVIKKPSSETETVKETSKEMPVVMETRQETPVVMETMQETPVVMETRQEMPVVEESSKEFTVGTKIGERKIKEKVVFENGRKKIILEDCGVFPKCTITLP